MQFLMHRIDFMRSVDSSYVILVIPFSSEKKLQHCYRENTVQFIHVSWWVRQVSQFARANNNILVESLVQEHIGYQSVSQRWSSVSR